MKKDSLLLMVAVVTLLWLMPNDMHGQKLTSVNSDYASKDGTFSYDNQEWNYDVGHSFFFRDVNNDGKLEALVYQGFTLVWRGDTIRKSGVRWIDMEGQSVKEEPFLPNPETLKIMDDLNGDGIMDFVIGGNGSSSLTINLSTGESYTTTKLSTFNSNYSPCVADINHDGRKDVVCYRYNGDSRSYVPVAFIQTAEHSFLYQELSVVTEEHELENIDFSTGGNGAYTVSGGVSSISIANGMWAKAPQLAEISFAPRRALPMGEETKSDIAAVDMNNDGYPDIISNSYPTLLSLPDGRYYAGNLNGKATIADINGDGLKDIVMFNTTAQSVWLYLSQIGGGYTERKLIDNGSITDIYCQDFDGDGLTDIMLQAATNNSSTIYSDNNYSFIVFFKNKGNGEFTKKENMLNGLYAFSKPYDFDNNGKASVMGCKFLKKGGNNPLRHITWDDKFNLTDTEVVCNDIPLYLYTSFYQYDAMPYSTNFRIADFDGDGFLDILCNNGESNYYNGYNHYNLKSYLYSPASTSANTAPQQMAAPNIIYDKQSGRAKVEWPVGIDKETASGDLTYTVRMGTAEGKQDLMLYDAGVSRYCVADASTWDKGKVYVSICATDANGKSGMWSPSATFDVKTQSAEFTFRNKDFATDHFTTADTLVVHSINGKALTYTLPNDGKVIQQMGDSAYIVFGNYGEKTITASLEGCNHVTHKLTVLPIKAVKSGNYEFPSVIVDLDGDGKSEGLVLGMKSNGSGEYLGGLYVYENHKYIKMPTMFNSDVKAICNPTFIDRTMNGLPDIYSNDSWSINKNGKTYHWILNRGDLDFEVDNAPLCGISNQSTYVDLNNDGFMDYNLYKHKEGYWYGTYINNGDFTFEDRSLPYGIYADLNRDGLIDVIEGRTIYLNKGNAEFEKVKEITLADGEYGEKMVIDINNDGYPDYITYTGTFRDLYNRDATDYQTYAYLGSRDMAYTERIALPGKPLKIDIDNNGFVDYLVAGETDIYGSKGDYIFAMGEANGYTIMSYPSSHFGSSRLFLQSLLPDMNNDGKPDVPSDNNLSTIICSSFTNTPPAAPTTVVVTQDDEFVVVSWSGATDKETPNVGLRYNLSVKEKGKTGDGSYIISPMNQTLDAAKTIDNGTMQYRYATRFPIPFNRFTIGKTYEVQVQTIDGWCEHSPFSKVVEFTPTAKTLFTMAEKAGVEQPVAFVLKDNSGTVPNIDTDGGVIKDNAITWSTPGVKTVAITAGETTCTRQIIIVDKPTLSFEMPEQVLTESSVQITLPEGFNCDDATAKLTVSKGMTYTIDKENGKANIMMPSRTGSYAVTIEYEDNIFGVLSESKDVTVLEYMPEISRVSATSEGCVIQWNNTTSADVLKLLTGKVKVYRETIVSGHYEPIAEVDISDGLFIDKTARPDVKSCRYLIKYPTVYGSESAASRIHGTVLLMANQGLNNNINLHWNDYAGRQVATYTIYSGSSRDNLQQIDEVSGNTLSYVHRRSNEALQYYAIGYTLQDEQNLAPVHRASPMQNIFMSNVVCSDEAYNVIMVQNIEVIEKDGHNTLNKEQTKLNMQAIVTPALATLARVEWNIIAGDNLAEIDNNGLLIIKENKTGGTVTVRARSIDGSDVFGTMNVMVEPYHTGLITGDANADGNVDVADIVEIVNYIMGKPSVNLVLENVDLNGDGEVNIGDIILIVKAILNNSNSSGPAMRRAIGKVDFSQGTATQFELKVDEDALVNDIHLVGSMSKSHMLMYQQKDKCTYSVVLYSLSNQLMNPDNGEIIDVESNTRNVTMQNIVIATPSGELYRYQNSDSTTGIRQLENSTKSTVIYDLKGNRMQDAQGLTKGVYIVNGKKAVVK